MVVCKMRNSNDKPGLKSLTGEMALGANLGSQDPTEMLGAETPGQARGTQESLEPRQHGQGALRWGERDVCICGGLSCWWREGQISLQRHQARIGLPMKLTDGFRKGLSS